MSSWPAPVVSVAITAYNHQELLPVALESVLEQKLDFPIEIVIGEDCSHDKTIAVARAYQQRYPEIIRLFVNETNRGVQQNTYSTLERCRGEFTAWLDADDYWTDPNKLVTQVAAMRSDPSLSVCFHYVRWVTGEGKVQRRRYPDMPPGRYGLEDMLRRCFIATPSAMFRTGIHRHLPAWYRNRETSPLSDWPVWVTAARHGDILLLDANMADYVMAPNSLLTSKGALEWYRTDIRFYGYILPDMAEHLHPMILQEKAKRYEALAYGLARDGRFGEARRAAARAFSTSPTSADRARRLRLLTSVLVKGAVFDTRSGVPEDAASV